MNSSLNVIAVITEEVAAVELAGVGVDGFYDHDLKASGWSKKHPTDDANPDIAFNLAMARALQKLANLYAQEAATLAGFPVAIDLEVEANGRSVALEHYPAPAVSVNIEEEVSY